MNQKTDNPKSISIKEIADKQTQYIVPIYQRNYAWGKDEIDALVQDIRTAQERRPKQNYYIGSLVVYKRSDGSYEVIDGQQRLTTLSILLAALGEHEQTIKLGFEHRDESNTALDRIRTDASKPDNENSIDRGFKLMGSALKEQDAHTAEFKQFLLEKVCIIRTEVPADTDLNHYFEIMNNRGEQLEKHEVLKAQMMGSLKTDPKQQHVFAAVWDACSDMQRYAVMGIEAAVRKTLFSASWTDIPKDFASIAKHFAEKTDVSGSSAETLDMLLEADLKTAQANEQKEWAGNFESVIDFPNFLMHVFRIYLEHSGKKSKEEIEKIALDDKFLLSAFDEHLGIDKDEDKIRDFLTVLLQCRLLFDRYVIKSNVQKHDGAWSLQYAKPPENSNSSMSYINSFKNSEDNQTIIMLQAMFHVSQPSRNYKNWLYAMLRWLFEQRIHAITAADFEQFLNKLSDKFYFGRYSYGKNPVDFLDLILDAQEISTESLDLHNADSDFWKQGTHTPHFVFNRLEYALWKSYKEFSIDENKARKPFYFAFRNSVEHFQPQTDINQNETNPAGDALDHFGNLCLLSHSDNSKLSNSPPQAKKALMEKTGNIPSLKQFVMMQGISDESQEWNEEKITQHGNAMINLLNRPFHQAR